MAAMSVMSDPVRVLADAIAGEIGVLRDHIDQAADDEVRCCGV